MAKVSEKYFVFHDDTLTECASDKDVEVRLDVLKDEGADPDDVMVIRGVLCGFTFGGASLIGPAKKPARKPKKAATEAKKPRAAKKEAADVDPEAVKTLRKFLKDGPATMEQIRKHMTCDKAFAKAVLKCVADVETSGQKRATRYFISKNSEAAPPPIPTNAAAA